MKFDDQNGVRWDIRTTTTTIDPGTTTGKFFATVDESSENDYTGNTSNRDFTTTNNHIVWSANGNPIIDGPGADNAALIAIKQFAAAEAGVPQPQKTIAKRKPSSASASGTSSLVPFILLAIAVWYADR